MLFGLVDLFIDFIGYSFWSWWSFYSRYTRSFSPPVIIVLFPSLFPCSYTMELYLGGKSAGSKLRPSEIVKGRRGGPCTKLANSDITFMLPSGEFATDFCWGNFFCCWDNRTPDETNSRISAEFPCLRGQSKQHSLHAQKKKKSKMKFWQRYKNHLLCNTRVIQKVSSPLLYLRN